MTVAQLIGRGLAAFGIAAQVATLALAALWLLLASVIFALTLWVVLA